MLNSPIAKVLKYDYRLDGSEQIICVTTDGTVRGYAIQNQTATKTNNFGVSNAENLNEILNELMKKKIVFFNFKLKNSFL